MSQIISPDCQILSDAIKNYEREMEIYSIQSINYGTFMNDWLNWKNRTGKYEKFKFYGQSQTFTVEWGFKDWDTTNTCRECAQGNKYGWGEGNKFGGGAWCNRSRDDNILNPQDYIDKGPWSDYGFWNAFRKRWTCNKNDGAIDRENREYEAEEPIPTTYYKLPQPNEDNKTLNDLNKYTFSASKSTGQGTPPTPPTFSIQNIVCCGINIDNIDVEGGNFTIEDLNQQCSQVVGSSTTEAPTVAPTTTGSPIETTMVPIILTTVSPTTELTTTIAPTSAVSTTIVPTTELTTAVPLTPTIIPWWGWFLIVLLIIFVISIIGSLIYSLIRALNG
jgi:hypothetical protein